jgi:hypothetical protein
MQFVSGAPSFEAFQLGQREARRTEIAPGSADCSHDAQRIVHPMLARCGDGVADPAVAKVGGNQRTSARRRHRVEQADIGIGRPAEGDDGDFVLFCRFLQPGKVGAVCRNYRDPAGLQPLEYLRFGINNRFLTAE